MEIKKRGIYFSLDALFATILLIGGLSALKVFYIAPDYVTTDYLSRDISNVIANVNVQDVDLTYLTKIMENGTTKNDNVTFMEKLGELWSQKKDYELRKVLNDFHQKYLPKRDFSVYFNGLIAYNSTIEPNYNLISTKRMVSGITANRSQTGFIARAIASKMVKNSTLIVMGDVVSSSVKKPNGGNNGNNVELTYTVNVPSNSTINDAYWFIEAAWTDIKFKAYINDVYVPGSDATGDKLLTDLKDYFHPGKNYGKIVYRVGSSGYEGGDDGASHIVVNFQTNRTSTILDDKHSFFAGVKSYCSIKYKKPVFIRDKINESSVYLALNSTNASLTINFNGVDYYISKKTVSNYTIIWNNSEIENKLNGFGLDYDNFTGKYVWFDVDIDTYSSKEYKGNLRQIYNSSFVYTNNPEKKKDLYGYVSITSIINNFDYSNSQYGDFYRNLSWYFNYSNSTIPLFFDSQFAWLYYTGATPSQLVKANLDTLYSSPPSSLIKEFARFGYTNKYMKNGKNNFSLSFGSGYGINPFKSLAYFTFLVKNLVPYGNTFDSEEDALNDAKQRLNNTLGSNVKALKIETKAMGVGHVPSLWGPLLVEVRSWK